MTLLGLDIGTTGCKAVAFDAAGREVARRYREYPLSYPRPGWVEIAPELIWQSACQVMQEVNAQVSGDPVQALAISCQGEAVLPIDADGKPLYNFIITFDNRTLPQSAWWAETLGAERIFRITGMPLHPMYSLNKIMWLRANEPSLAARAWKFLCVEDFLIYRLCGEAVTDPSLAARTMALDISARDWSEEMLRHAGTARELLPAILPSGSAVGTVTPNACRETGLRPGTIIATGGHDQPCGALGAGAVRPGMAINATGTSDVLCPAMPYPVLNAAMRQSNYCCYPHTCEDAYCSIAFNLTGGLLLRWYRDTLCAEEVREARAGERDPYDVMLAHMAPHPATAFFLPHFVGAGTPYLEPQARGALVGLTLDTDKAALTRAVIDSTNYEMKLNIDRMEAAGIVISELRAIGGGAKSAAWLQMKADVFAKPVTVIQTTEAAALGAALLAGKAAGFYHSAREAAEHLVQPGTTYYPDAQQHERYLQRYGHYQRIYRALADFNRELSMALAEEDSLLGTHAS